MFKALAHELPSYPELQDSCKQHLHTQDDRVLLSHLYADLVQFSIALYYMFSRGQQGMSHYVQKILPIRADTVLQMKC